MNNFACWLEMQFVWKFFHWSERLENLFRFGEGFENKQSRSKNVAEGFDDHEEEEEEEGEDFQVEGFSKF